MGVELLLGLLGGLALFLYGMQMMSNNLEAAAGNKMKQILEKLTTNRFMGILVGAGITALIQSSSATTVMTVGFVNSGLMSLNQAVWIIMGANIGTTITGQLIALDVGALAPLIAFIGVVLVVFVKNKKLQHIGGIVAGVGVIFIGMGMMSDAMLPLRDEPEFIQLMTSFKNPLLGVMAGALFTAVIQSSAASIGILQALAVSGVIGLHSAVFVLFGQNIGTCITAVLASVGTNRNAKRTTAIHLMFNVVGTVIFVVLCMVTPFVDWMITTNPANPAAQIANVHTIFNIATTVILFPFGPMLVNIAKKILPDTQVKHVMDADQWFEGLMASKHHLGVSTIAINQIHDEITLMMDVAASDDLEIIVSNTTEAGIQYDPSCKKDDCPPSSFPAKLTQVLYHRYKAGKPGIVMLACELIDNNGKELLKCVNQYIDQWELEDSFRKYVNEDCTFCGSLVDRIVPGRIRDEKEVAELEEKHGYADPLLDVGEVFGVWVIEGDEKLNDVLPFKKAGLLDKVFVTPDMSPYKKRKVRILNGAHTGFVLGAYLAGENIVRDCMNDETIKGFMNKMLYDEVIPTLPLDKDDLMQFAAAVEDRFNNPFVNHELMSISLNSTSKWKARNMPSFLGYIEEKGCLPQCLTMSLAAYIAFYSNEIQSLTDAGLVCRRPAGNEYTVSDDRWALEFYYAHRNDTPEALVHAVLTNEQMWDQDLTKIAGLEETVTADLKMIRTEGAKAAFASCL